MIFLGNLAGAEILSQVSPPAEAVFWDGYQQGLVYYARVFDHPCNVLWQARTLPADKGRLLIEGFYVGFLALRVGQAVEYFYRWQQHQEGFMSDQDEMSADNYGVPKQVKLSALDFKRNKKLAEAEQRQGLVPDASYWDGYIRGMRINRGEVFAEPEHQAWLNQTTGDANMVALIVGFHDGNNGEGFDAAKKHLHQTLANMEQFTDEIAAKLAEKTAKKPVPKVKPNRQRMFVMDADDDTPDTLH